MTNNNNSPSENWVSVSDVYNDKLLRLTDGRIPKRGTIGAWCRQSLKQAERGEKPVFHTNSGDIGVVLFGSRWLIHREAIANFKAPRLGNPNFGAAGEGE